ncbi:hypothetical protein [Paraburkholderia sp. SIMBA_030]|uniref:hypothetical protein n=1 Tax=Paraburkholderia sp. SIMBA_030 TaxID=3085773 RepID=UPI00397B5B4F
MLPDAVPAAMETAGTTAAATAPAPTLSMLRRDADEISLSVSLLIFVSPIVYGDIAELFRVHDVAHRSRIDSASRLVAD